MGFGSGSQAWRSNYFTVNSSWIHVEALNWNWAWYRATDGYVLYISGNLAPLADTGFSGGTGLMTFW
jgi:hypothetical protein